MTAITPQALAAHLGSNSGLLQIDTQGNTLFTLANSNLTLLQGASILLEAFSLLTIQLNTPPANSTLTPPTITFVSQAFNTSPDLQNVYTVIFTIDGTRLDSRIIDPTI